MAEARFLPYGAAWIVSAGACFTAFVFDLSHPLGVAAGVTYAVIPLAGLLARSPRLVIVAAVTGVVLTTVGFQLSESDGSLRNALLNRALSVAVICAVALVCLRHLRLEERLRRVLEHSAQTDPLTGLYNRRVLFAEIERELARFHRSGERFAVILADADRFKRVNDEHGHVAGDGALQAIAKVCRQSVRQTDHVGRFGGEEFIILLPGTSSEKAGAVAARICRGVRAIGLRSNGVTVPLTLSLGVAQVEPRMQDSADVVRAADEALYAAKRTGRDRVVAALHAPARLAEIDTASEPAPSAAEGPVHRDLPPRTLRSLTAVPE